MNVPTIQGARSAARRLRDRYPGLTIEVEEALQSGGARRPDQYADVVSLAALVVSAAALTWQVYNDLKTRGPAPEPDAVQRDVTSRLDTAGTAAVGRDELERVIRIVVTETLHTARPAHPEEEDEPAQP